MRLAPLLSITEMPMQQRRSPVERPAMPPGFFCSSMRRHALHERDDLLRERLRRPGRLLAHDREFLRVVGEVDVLVEAAAPQGVGQLACPLDVITTIGRVVA